MKPEFKSISTLLQSTVLRRDADGFSLRRFKRIVDGRVQAEVGTTGDEACRLVGSTDDYGTKIRARIPPEYLQFHPIR